MLRLQDSVARLIYRYLASGGGKQQDHGKTNLDEEVHKTPAEKDDRKTHLEDNYHNILVEEAHREAREVDQATLLEVADRKTRLLLSMVRDIHTCVHITQHRTKMII